MDEDEDLRMALDQICGLFDPADQADMRNALKAKLPSQDSDMAQDAYLEDVEQWLRHFPKQDCPYALGVFLEYDLLRKALGDFGDLFAHFSPPERRRIIEQLSPRLTDEVFIKNTLPYLTNTFGDDWINPGTLNRMAGLLADFPEEPEQSDKPVRLKRYIRYPEGYPRYEPRRRRGPIL